MKKGVLLIISCLIIAMTMLIAFFGVLPENVVPNVPIISVSISAMDGTSINVNSKTGVKQQKMEFVATGTYTLEDETVALTRWNTSTTPPSYLTTAPNVITSIPWTSMIPSLNSPTPKPEPSSSLEPDYAKEGQDEIYHIVEISCKANDGGPGKVSDKVLLVLHYVNKEAAA
jgi:hypothetical protein